MAATDRNVLRLGAYEIFHSDTPPRVAIDEAVELAKRFGSAQSAQFVNGILDNLMHRERRKLRRWKVREPVVTADSLSPPSMPTPIPQSFNP